MPTIRDKEREAFENLIRKDIPKLLSSKSAKIQDRYLVQFTMYPIDLASAVDDKSNGSVYVTVKTLCSITDTENGEKQEFIIDLLNLPVYQELGYKIKGNYKQVLGAYERPAGFTFTRKPIKGSDIGSNIVNIHGINYRKLVFTNTNSGMPVVRFQKTKKSRDDYNDVSVSTFFRAISAYSEAELLEIFGSSNPFNLLAFGGSASSQIEMKGKRGKGKSLNNRNDCINFVANSMFSDSVLQSSVNTVVSLQQMIQNNLFNGVYFNFGNGNKYQLEHKQSFRNRANNKILAEDIHLLDETIPEGSILSTAILEKVDYSPIDTIKVLFNNKIYELHKFSFFSFRALGYYLAEDVNVADGCIKTGTKLTIDDLQKINNTDKEVLLVSERKNLTDVKEFSRRLQGDALTIEDLFTSYSIFVDNLNGFDTIDKEYELTNRVIIPFSKRALNAVSKNVSSVFAKIEKGIVYVEQSAEEQGDRLPLIYLIDKLKFDYNLNYLIEDVSKIDASESQMSDVNNVMSFLSKSYKITADVSDSAITDDLVRIQDTQIGRLDLYDAPESKKIGRVHHKTLLTQEDEFGYLKTPFYKVNNCSITDEVVYLTAAEEENLYIAEWNETFRDEQGELKKRVNVRYNGQIVTVDSSLVTLKEFSFLQNYGPSTSCIPFVNHSNGKRLTMSDNQQLQAVPQFGARRAIVNTGAESFLGVGRYTAHDIIDNFYSYNCVKYPKLSEYKDDIYASSLRLVNVLTDKNNSNRVYSFSIDAVENLRGLGDEFESLPLASIQLPFNYRTSDSGVFTYRVNNELSEYRGNDIVLHSADYDTHKYDMELITDFGGQKFDDSVFDTGAALGRDYLIAYKTWEGSTIDDAITINSDLVSDDLLTSLLLINVEESLINDGSRIESFERSMDSPSYFDVNGLPKIGTYLNPGDAVITKTVTRTGNGRDKSVKSKSVYLSVHQWGQVVAAYIDEKNGVQIGVVTLARRADARVGDKLAGRYGNKGVIAKIVPVGQMPFDPVSGKSIDIILNPLGIPSRMNISQLLEGLLGLSCRKKGKHVVISQFHPDTMDYIRKMADDTDTHPIKLIDGRTGKWFKRPINVVSLYMYKLVHMSIKKIHSIGMKSGVDNVTLQPKRGSKANGGQKFGEMESWCLEGIGALKTLQELQSTLSDDVTDKASARAYMLSRTGSDYEPKGENNNNLMFQALVRSMCADVETGCDSNGQDYYEFKPLTDEMIRALSYVPIKSDTALHSEAIFGNVSSIAKKSKAKELWGFIELHTKIISPLWIEKSSLSKLFLEKTKKSVKVLSANFFFELIHGLKYVRIYAQMDCLQIITVEDLKKLNDDEADEYYTGFAALIAIFEEYDVVASCKLLEQKIASYEQKYVVDDDDDKDKRENSATVNEYLESMGLGYLADNLSSSVDNEELETGTNATDYNRESYIKLIKVLRFVKDFIKRGASLKDYVITAYPVMSQVFRPQIKMPGTDSVPDFDHYYVQILNAADNVATNANEATVTALYEALADFMGFRKGKSKYINLSNWFLGIDRDSSHGKIRESVQSKVILRSGRAVIVPSADMSMDAMHAGVPITCAVVTWEEQIIAYLASKGAADRISQGSWKKILYAIANRNYGYFHKEYTDAFASAYKFSASVAYSKFYEWIKEFLEGNDSEDPTLYRPPQVILLGRQPSLHQFSVRGFYVKVVEDRAIHVNTLVCKGYNGDFDGDQMYYIAPISKECKEEIIEKASAASNMINPKNGNIELDMSQDIALGIYCATMLKDNQEALSEEELRRTPYAYSNVVDLRNDVYNSLIEPYDVVSLSHKGKMFLSTAGRIMFNSLLPHGLDGVDHLTRERLNFTNPLGLRVKKPERFCNLQFDGLITAGDGVSDKLVTFKLQNVGKRLYDELNVPDALHVSTVLAYQGLVEFGFKMADLYGISLSLDDLNEISDNSNKKEFINKMQETQALLEEDYQMGLLSDEDKLTAIMKLTKDTVSSVQQDLFSTMNRNNNVFIMWDSGARGSKAQITQTCGAIGMLDKTDTQTLETPLLCNYHEGMSNFDVQQMSYSTRMGMSSTSNKTADAGYATRQSIYMTSGLKIVEWDCGKVNWWFDVLWDTPIESLSKLKPSYEYFKYNLLGRKVWRKDSVTLDVLDGTLQDGVITEDSFSVLAKGFHSIVLESRKSKRIGVDELGKNLGYIIVCSNVPVETEVVSNDLASVPGLEYLDVVTPDELLITKETLIGCELVNDEKSEIEFKNFMRDGRLTKKCVNIVNSKHLLRVNTNLGEFTFRYHMTPACRSLLEKREATNLKYLKLVQDPAHRSDLTYIITEKTLDYIEEEGLERIEARILLDCLSGRDESKHGTSPHGCCARCYGLKYTNDMFPKVGEIVGIEAAQAVGEPATQLTISLVNKGGAAGESVASGVTVFQNLLSGTVPSAETNTTLIAGNSGYLSIDKLDDSSIVKIIPVDKNSELCKKCRNSFGGECPHAVGGNSGLCTLDNKVLTNRLVYTNGTYVKAGEPLTDGYVQPDAILHTDPDTLEVLLRKKQMIWLLNYFNTFYQNNIYINARHFEIFARLQNLMVLVVKSNDPAFEVGRLYESSEIINHEEDLLVLPKISKQKEVVVHNSGALTALSFENVPSLLADFATKGLKSYRNSPIGALNVGENLVKARKKYLRVNKHANVNFEESAVFNINDEIIVEANVDDTAGQELNLDLMDLNSIFGDSSDSALDNMNLFDVSDTSEVSEKPESNSEEIYKSIDEGDTFDSFDDADDGEDSTVEVEHTEISVSDMNLF